MSLRFKGDSKKRKIKRSKQTKEESLQEQDSAQGWVRVDSVSDIAGPCLILSTATPISSILACDTQYSLFFSPMNSNDLSDIEPNSVNQVFQAKRLLDSNKIAIKSCFERHLGTDKFGLVECNKLAVGMDTEWVVIPKEDGFGFQSNWDSYLSLHIPESESTSLKDVKLRCDSDSIGSKETFIILCQASVLSQAKRIKKEQELDVLEIEQGKLKEFQGSGKLGSDFGVGLGKAMKEGKLNEALLDKRSKLKRDKFCW